ncbi:triadin [Harpegnathos saltator]|uniref:triadin n=1 Tax=Harpegnathos saltator TaxID=610380 RepID=UPI000DBED14C|nr:triadin [Harpegnathos saltator]
MAVASSPKKREQNVFRGVKRVLSPETATLSPTEYVSEEERRKGTKERRILPPSIDMEEEEDMVVGAIEVQRGLIRTNVHPKKEGKPRIREDVKLNTRVRVDRGSPPRRTEKEKITSIVEEAMKLWEDKNKNKADQGRNIETAHKKEKKKGGVPNGQKKQGPRQQPKAPPPPPREEYPPLPQRPPRFNSEPKESWAKVVGRKKEGEKERKRNEGKGSPQIVVKEKSANKKSKRRVPNTAAISITAEKGKYKELLTEAKKKINIDELGISKIRTRQGVTGALILEIPGEDRNTHADNLAKKLSEVLAEKAKVTRPQKMGEIRIRGLEVSTSEEEAAQRVAQAGGCRVAEVQTGVIRTTPSGYRSLWMRCPLAAAKKVAEKGTLSLGWTQVKVWRDGPPSPQLHKSSEVCCVCCGGKTGGSPNGGAGVSPPQQEEEPKEG